MYLTTLPGCLLCDIISGVWKPKTLAQTSLCMKLQMNVWKFYAGNTPCLNPLEGDGTSVVS